MTSPVLTAVKLGYWTADPTGLLKRYTTTYGRSICIRCFKVPDCRQVEKDLFQRFHYGRIDDAELFDEEYLEDYMDYLEEKAEESFVLQHICAHKRKAEEYLEGPPKKAVSEYAGLIPTINANDQSTVNVTVNIHSDVVTNHAAVPNTA